MKKQIRRGAFETNSSSTHTITICTEEEFNKWKRGDLLFNRYDHIFTENKEVPEEEMQELMQDYYDSIKNDYYKDYKDLSSEELEKIRSKVLSEYVNEDDDDTFETYDQWYNDDYLEVYEKEYTSPSGDKIVCFGKYGYDG